MEKRKRKLRKWKARESEKMKERQNDEKHPKSEDGQTLAIK